MTLKEWQSSVDRWIQEIGVRYFNETTNALLLSEEVGEFNKIIARVYGEQSFKIEKTKDEIKKELTDELGDIFFVLTCLANQLEIDLSLSLQQNILKKTNRDFTRHKTNKKLKE